MPNWKKPWGDRQSVTSDLMKTAEGTPLLKQMVEKKIPSKTARALLATPLLPDTAKEFALHYVDPKGAENMKTVVNSMNRLYDFKDTTSQIWTDTKRKFLPEFTQDMHNQKSIWDTPLGGTRRRRQHKKRRTRRRRYYRSK